MSFSLRQPQVEAAGHGEEKERGEQDGAELADDELLPPVKRHAERVLRKTKTKNSNKPKESPPRQWPQSKFTPAKQTRRMPPAPSKRRVPGPGPDSTPETETWFHPDHPGLCSLELEILAHVIPSSSAAMGPRCGSQNHPKPNSSPASSISSSENGGARKRKMEFLTEIETTNGGARLSKAKGGRILRKVLSFPSLEEGAFTRPAEVLTAPIVSILIDSTEPEN